MTDATASTESLYAKQKRIHAREVDGVFDRLRVLCAATLLGAFYLIPWLQWGGRQAVLFDLPARRFHVFGMTLWPQDFIYLAWLLIMAALLLFMTTAVAGRLWCGYACPQTVWTEIFVAIERLFEGPYNRRIKLEKKPWTAEKVARKFGKRSVWLILAAWTGLTFVGYFTPVRDLTVRLFALELGTWETFWICFYGLATFGNAGQLREQVCMYMCPYARFQSAMFDENTLIVSYDAARGEQRGSRKRGEDPRTKGLGDCIDCNICVQACPTGIDIRDGLQYECIACASCVDACDSVMDRMGYPRGLVKYTTQRALEGKPSNILRPRTIVYGTILGALSVGFVISILNRPMLRVDVIRDRNAMFRESVDGLIENVYTLKVLNKDAAAHTLEVTVEGLPGAVVQTDPEVLEMAPESLRSVAARVLVPPDEAGVGGREIRFVVQDSVEQELTAARKSRFFAPVDR